MVHLQSRLMVQAKFGLLSIITTVLNALILLTLLLMWLIRERQRKTSKILLQNIHLTTAIKL